MSDDRENKKVRNSKGRKIVGRNKKKKGIWLKEEKLGFRN